MSLELEVNSTLRMVAEPSPLQSPSTLRKQMEPSTAPSMASPFDQKQRRYSRQDEQYGRLICTSQR